MVEQLENRRTRLSSLCAESTEKVLQKTELINSFLEMYNAVSVIYLLYLLPLFQILRYNGVGYELWGPLFFCVFLILRIKLKKCFVI